MKNIVEEIKIQIMDWRKQQDQLEDMIEEAHSRLDELEGNLIQLDRVS